MTKEELIAALANFPDDIEIVLSQDPEGNYIRQLDEVSEYTDDMVVLWPNDTLIEDEWDEEE